MCGREREGEIVSECVLCLFVCLHGCVCIIFVRNKRVSERIEIVCELILSLSKLSANAIRTLSVVCAVRCACTCECM